MTPSVSRLLIAIETLCFEDLILFHLECSRQTLLCTYYGNVESASGGCRFTHKLSLLVCYLVSLVYIVWNFRLPPLVTMSYSHHSGQFSHMWPIEMLFFFAVIAILSLRLETPIRKKR